MEKIKIIKINEASLEKYEEDMEIDKSNFSTDKKIEVRIPCKSYYLLKVKCIW